MGTGEPLQPDPASKVPSMCPWKVRRLGWGISQGLGTNWRLTGLTKPSWTKNEWTLHGFQANYLWVVNVLLKFFCCMSFGTTLWQKGHQQKWPTWHFGSSGWLHPATIPTQGLPFGPLQLSNINTSRSTTLMHSWRVTGVKTPVMRSRQSPDISVIQ